MNFIDLHIHLQDFESDYSADIVKKAQKSGLKKMVCAATSEDDWKKVADLAVSDPEMIIPAFGIHPWYIKKASLQWDEKLIKQCLAFKSVLIGETGLDALKDDIKTQKQIFIRHLEIASLLRRAVVIHNVKAFGFLSDIWDKFPPFFMFHSFNARVEQLKEILSRGAYVSFGASILKNRDGERILLNVPKDKILLESDAPYQAYDKNNPSTPFFIPELLKKISAIRGDDIEELARQLFENSQKFISAV
ncbi:MAG: TatD family hydrolase [Alphaproteobacteria bacterium]|nr:TatD family hydrolase [Alphaproteobacteria bacterium]